MHGGFGDAVHVDQFRRAVAMPFNPGKQSPEFQRFSTKNDKPQTQIFFASRSRRIRLHELLKCRWGLVQDCDAFPRQ